MTKKCKLIKIGDSDSEYLIESGAAHKTFAKFIKWNNNIVEEVSVRVEPETYMEIKNIYFCEKKNQLEIWSDFGETKGYITKELENCILDCTQVYKILFKEMEGYKEEFCFVADDSSPEVKKGSILIGY